MFPPASTLNRDFLKKAIMKDEESIELLKGRDFSSNFNEAFALLRNRFRNFGSALLFIAGPFILLASVLNGIYQARLLETGQMGSSILEGNLMIVLLVIAASFVAQGVLYSTVIDYLLVYEEKGDEELSLKTLREWVKRDVGRILGGMLGIGLILVPVVMILTLVFVLFGVSAPLLTGITFLIFFVGLLILIPPFGFAIVCTLFLILRRDLPVFSAFGRSFQLMKGEFWETWLYSFISMVLIAMASFIFMVPTYLLTWSSMMAGMDSIPESSLLLGLTTVLGGFLSTMANGIFVLLMGFHYYSLTEKKTGEGALKRIESIGEGQDRP